MSSSRRRHEVPAALKREREKAIELATKNIKHRSSRNTELLKAAAKGKHEKLVQLLTKGGVDINCKDIETEDTPLHYAVVAGMRRTVSYLIRQGADPDPVNLKGLTPIHVAVFYDYASIVRCLSSNDADVNKKDKEGSSPISIALERNFERSFSALIEYGANFKELTRTGAIPLLEAAARGWTKGVVAICDKCDEEYLATQNAAGHTALHFAAVNGRKSVAEALLQCSTSLVKIRNGGGFLAYDLATSSGHTELAEVIKKAGAAEQEDSKSRAERRKTWRQSLLGVSQSVGSPPPVRAGYLMCMDNKKPVKKWFELRDGILYQFDREGGKQEHLLHLFGTSVAEEKTPHEKLGKHVFVITTPANKNILFGSDEQEEVTGWVGALKKRKANLAYLAQKTDTMNSQEFRDLKKTYQESNANDNNQTAQPAKASPPVTIKVPIQSKTASEGSLNLAPVQQHKAEPLLKPGSSFLDLSKQSKLVESASSSQHGLSEFDYAMQGAEISGSTLLELEKNLENHITQRLFEREWIALEEKELNKPHRELSSEAVMDYNLSKNRYTNVIPYNETRVKLSLIDGYMGTDYINANYVSCGNKYFIATQAPTPATFADFYRMIWENDCKHIVMLTRFEEMGRIKAHDYLPRRGPTNIGNFLVELTSVSQPNDSYCVFGVKITKDGESREFTQYHFLAWPDHGVADPIPLLKLINIVHPVSPNEEEDANPVVVHCSAGIGRTGTWIAVSAFLEEFSLSRFVNSQKSGVRPINLMRTISLLRSQRGGMLTTFDQYEFIYNLMLQHLKELNSRLPKPTPPPSAPVSRTTPTPSPRNSNENNPGSPGKLTASGNWVAANGPVSPRSLERANSASNMKSFLGETRSNQTPAPNTNKTPAPPSSTNRTPLVHSASGGSGTVGRATIGSRRPTVAEDTFTPSNKK